MNVFSISFPFSAEHTGRQQVVGQIT